MKHWHISKLSQIFSEPLLFVYKWGRNWKDNLVHAYFACKTPVKQHTFTTLLQEKSFPLEAEPCLLCCQSIPKMVDACMGRKSILWLSWLQKTSPVQRWQGYSGFIFVQQKEAKKRPPSLFMLTEWTSFANDCILMLSMFYTRPKFLGNKGLMKLICFMIQQL